MGHKFIIHFYYMKTKIKIAKQYLTSCVLCTRTFISKLTVLTMPKKNLITVVKWAMTWQNQQNDCAPSESDQPGHPPSLIRVFTVRSMVAEDPRFFHTDSEDSDQTGRMPRLIWVFAMRTLILLVLSCGGSNNVLQTIWKKNIIFITWNSNLLTSKW